MNEHAVVVLVADLLSGGTILLGLGTLVVALSGAPVHRQRAAELAILATVVWLVLALVPLPRRALPAAAPDVSSPVQQVPRSPAADPADLVTEPVGTASLPAAPERGDLLLRLGELQTVESARDPSAAGDFAARAPAVASGSLPRWLRVAFAVYVAGAVTALANVLLGAILVRRLVARATAPPSWLADLFEARRRALGVCRCRLRVTSASRRPLSAGIADPSVLLPAVLVDPGREEELRCIIDHELVHTRRGDIGSRAFLAGSAVVLWPHPLFWFLRSRALLAAELIADDAAASAFGRSAYARTLVSLAEELHALAPAPRLVPGTYRHPTELTRRVEMLISKHDHLATRWSAARRAAHLTGAIAAVALSTVMFGVRPDAAEASLPDDAVTPTTDALDAGVASQQAPPVSRQQQRQPPQARRLPQSEQQPQPQRQPQPQLQPDRQERPQPQSQQQPQEMPDLTPGLQAPQRVQQPQQDIDAFYAETLALAERAIRLKSDLVLAAGSFEDAKRKHAAGALDEFGVTVARTALESAQRTLQAVLILVESEIDATQLEMAEIEKQIQLGQLGDSARAQQIRLQGRLRVLQSVL